MKYLILIIIFMLGLQAKADPLQGQIEKNEAFNQIKCAALWDAIHKPFQGMVTQKVTEDKYFDGMRIIPGKTEEFVEIDQVYKKLQLAYLPPDERRFDASLIKNWPALTGYTDPPPINLTDILKTVWNVANNQLTDRNHDGFLSKEELYVEYGNRFTQAHNAIIGILIVNYDYLVGLTNREQYNGL